MFTGYQYFVYFHTKTSHVNEKMQKRATKFIISLKKYSYKDHLIQLNLPTLKYRRLRWDMTEVFKIVSKNMTLYYLYSSLPNEVVNADTTI